MLKIQLAVPYLWYNDGGAMTIPDPSFMRRHHGGMPAIFSLTTFQGPLLDSLLNLTGRRGMKGIDDY